jgi:hypothetical protein
VQSFGDDYNGGGGAGGREVWLENVPGLCPLTRTCACEWFFFKNMRVFDCGQGGWVGRHAPPGLAV